MSFSSCLIYFSDSLSLLQFALPLFVSPSLILYLSQCAMVACLWWRLERQDRWVIAEVDVARAEVDVARQRRLVAEVGVTWHRWVSFV